LRCHPSSPTVTVRAIDASLHRIGPQLELTFRLLGDIRRILIPQSKPASIGSELWRHTCCEVFIAIEGEARYHEFNFAPSSEWAVYEFEGYRHGAPLTEERLAPQIAVHCTKDTLDLTASIRLDLVSDAYAVAPLSIGLAAVVEGRDGFSYWALRHPREKPDFHDRGGFALRLEGA